MTTVEKCNRLYELDERKRALTADLEAVKEEIESLQAQLVETFADEGLQSVKGTNGVTFSLREDRRPDYPLGKEAAIARLQGTEYGDLVKLDLNYQTARSFIIECDKNGGIPEALQDVLGIYRDWKIGIARGKGRCETTSN